SGQRILEYDTLFDETHIVVFSSKEHKLLPKKVGKNTFLYPTNSKNRWFYIYDAIKISKNIIKEKKLNRESSVITTQDPFETGVVGWFLSLKTKIKLNIQIHTDIFSPYFIGGHLLNNIRIILARFLIPRADSIRVVTKRIKNSIISILDVYESKIIVLPIFVDIEKIKKTKSKINLNKKYPQFDFIILMASRIENEKNFPLALGVFKKIIKTKPKTGLIIIGEGKREGFIKNLVKENDLSKFVIFENWTDNLIPYKTANMFLLTSDYEGYGLTLIEAISSRCPIVTTRVGIVNEVLEDGVSALICNPKDDICLYKKILKLMDNEIDKNKLIKNASVSIKKYLISDKNEYLENYKNVFKL
ncbi:MAG: glycosyltransferase, partial [Patescibacteria group bacterium]